MFDPIVESVKNKYTDRSIRGIEKYIQYAYTSGIF